MRQSNSKLRPATATIWARPSNSGTTMSSSTPTSTSITQIPKKIESYRNVFAKRRKRSIRRKSSAIWQQKVPQQRHRRKIASQHPEISTVSLRSKSRETSSISRQLWIRLDTCQPLAAKPQTHPLSSTRPSSRMMFAKISAA